MDEITHAVELIKAVIEEWAVASYGDPTIETMVICDDICHQYLMVSSGWTPKMREHAILFHARIREGKVWIEWGGTHPSITEELIARGIKREDPVLNWHDPDVRALTEAQAG